MEKSNNFFVKNKSILTFLILEVVALTAFNFGNVGYIFGLASALLAVVAAVFVINIEKDKLSLLWLLLPFTILGFISILGATNGFSKVFSKISNLSLLFALPTFFLLGFFVRKFNDVKPKTVMLVVGAGFAAITFFGLASTLIEYGFFYSLIHKAKPLYYFNGTPYKVTEEMYWLNGFGFSEVFIEYGALFAVLCGAFLPSLLFISPKKERNDFIIAASIGGVGLVTLLVIPCFKGLIVLAVASLFAVVYKFLVGRKLALKIIGFSFIGVVALGIIFFVLALFNASKGFVFSGFLDRVFVSNGIMNNCKLVFQKLFATNLDGSRNINGLAPIETNNKALLMETHIFEVQLLKEVGLFGTFLFIGFIIMMGYFVYRYVKKSNDSSAVKVSIVVMLLAFFIYETLFYLIFVAPHGDGSYLAFLRNPTLFVMLFLFGYVFIAPTLKKEEKKHE